MSSITFQEFTVYSDRHVDYTPSASGIYWTFDTLSMGDHDNVTALAETMKRGYNLQTDKITAKSGGPVNYYYPMGAALRNIAPLQPDNQIYHHAWRHSEFLGFPEAQYRR